MSDSLENRIQKAVQNPQNMGEMESADTVGTAGSPGCGDMMRVWLKFREENGKKVIDQASFQGFGCETAIAVASVATELVRGKSIEDALTMKGEELAAPLGPLPPMKIHCATLVEEALRYALQGKSQPQTASPVPTPSTLSTSIDQAGKSKSGVKIVFKTSTPT